MQNLRPDLDNEIKALFRQGHYDDLVDLCVANRIQSPFLHMVLLEFGHDTLTSEISGTFHLASTKWTSLETTMSKQGETVENWDIGIPDLEDCIRQCERSANVEDLDLTNYWAVVIYIRYFLSRDRDIPNHRMDEIQRFIGDETVLGLLIAGSHLSTELEEKIKLQLDQIQVPIKNFFLMLGILKNPQFAQYRSKLEFPKKNRSIILYSMLFGVPGRGLSASLQKWPQIRRYAQVGWASMPAINLASWYLKSQMKAKQK